jgi:hypothetical protein
MYSVQAYCGKHSRRRENSESSPKKMATPRKEPMTEAEKREARLLRFVLCCLFCVVKRKPFL